MRIGSPKRLPWMLASFLLLVSFPVESRTPAPANNAVEEAQLLGLTNDWISAINRKDRARLETLMAPNFVLHAWDESWKVDRGTWLKNLFERLHLDEYRHWSIVPRVYGETGIVTSQWYWRGTRDNKRFEDHGFVLDVWQHKGNAWQVVSRISAIQPGKD